MSRTVHAVDEEWLPWRAAMERALYGPAGFFVTQRPARHFRTSVHASPLFAGAVAELLLRVDAALGRPPRLDFADMGAGGGELAAGVLAAVPREVAARLRVHAVERAPRPPGLDPRITWTARPPEGLRGLLFANEWLDNVPLDVAALSPAGRPHYVEVHTATGEERLGAAVDAADAAWLRRWWPLGPAGAGGEAAGAGPDAAAADPDTPEIGGRGEIGGRAEIGLARDRAWASATACLAQGLAVAVDYAHEAAARPERGTLTGYRDGRQVPPVPDGSCDLTAHVAMDSLPGRRTTQRAALRALGVDGARPPLTLAAADPAGYVRALAAASQAAELLSPESLGAFTWLAAPTGPPATAAALLEALHPARS
jgi:SAM-dependent MidA family methyltransferase